MLLELISAGSSIGDIPRPRATFREPFVLLLPSWTFPSPPFLALPFPWLHSPPALAPPHPR